MKCAACGTELQDGLPPDLVAKGWREVHTPERCRDRLAARLAEVEQAWSEQHHKFTSEHVSLAAQLATAVEALERIAAPQDGGLAAIDMRRSIAREALAAISATGGKETGK